MSKTQQYRIHHTTTYQYEDEINSCVMMFCLQPRNTSHQTVREFYLKTDPATQYSVEFDAFDNRHQFCDIHQEHDQLTIQVDALVEHQPLTQTIPTNLVASDQWLQLDNLEKDWGTWEFLRPSPLTVMSDALSAWIAGFETDSNDSPLDRLSRLAEKIRGSFDYVPGSTDVDSTIDDLLTQGKGVCQDYVHLMLSVARTWGIPARYVSGYIYDTTSDGSTANAMHAWLECWLPEIGWLSFDPTNKELNQSVLIPVAVGRDYRDVIPSRGITLGGGHSRLTVGVSVVKESDSQTNYFSRMLQIHQQ